MINNPKVVSMPIEDVKPYPKNPRKISEAAVEAVAESIRAFGFKVPILVDSGKVIIAGHTRLKAAKQLGLKHVPVLVADDLSEEEVRAFRIVDNKTHEKSVWELELLSSELRSIDLTMPAISCSFSPLELESYTCPPLPPPPLLPAQEGVSDSEGSPTIKRHKISVSHQQYLVFQEAVSMLREGEPNLSEGEVLERVVEEWIRLSGAA